MKLLANLRHLWGDEMANGEQNEKLRERLSAAEAKLWNLLYHAQGNGFIGESVDDAIVWAMRQMGESCRLRSDLDALEKTLAGVRSMQVEAHAECQRLRAELEYVREPCQRTSEQFEKMKSLEDEIKGKP